MKSGTYNKLPNGTWGGVRITSTDVRPGETVSVRKRDGTVNEETVATVIRKWSGYSICSIQYRQDPVSITSIPRAPRQPMIPGRCRGCGDRIDVWEPGYQTGYCEDCF